MFNWSKTVKYLENIITPKNLNDLIKIAKKGNYTILGGGHSFNNIAGSDLLVNIENFKNVLNVDLKENTITVEAGIKIYELEDYLKQYKRALYSCGSIRDQTLGGVMSNCVNSLGGKYITQICDTIIEITYIDNEGLIKKIKEPNIKYYSTHLGSICGLIYSAKIKISDKTYCKYYDDYIDVNNIQEYINNINNSKTPKLCEFMYFFNNPKVAVFIVEPFKDKTNINETIISSNNSIALEKNNNNNNKNNNNKINAIKLQYKLSKLVKKYGIEYMNRFRNHIKEGENINHISKAWFRGGKYVSEPIAYIEFYVPNIYINDIIKLLTKMEIYKIEAYYIQMRPFLKSKHLLCPSYKEDVISIIFGSTLKDIKKNMYILDILNFVGVRWHWGEVLDVCIYDGYIERVFSNKVRDDIEKKMINKNNMRPSLVKAIKHVADYKENWKTMFGNNLKQLQQLYK